MIHLYPRDITRLIRTMETLLLSLFGIYNNHMHKVKPVCAHTSHVYIGVATTLSIAVELLICY